RIGRRLHVEDVRDPRPHEALLRLPDLVSADGRGCRPVHLGIAARKRGAIPPMGTAPRFSQIATSRRKMLARNGVVLMSTPNRSGQTDVGSAITYSKMLAFRSHRAALRPAA